MLPYYVLLILVVGLGLIASPLPDPSRRRIVVALSFAAISFMTGLRAVTVGTDTFGYSLQYKAGYRREDEPGYAILGDAASSLGLNFQAFLLMVALFVTGSVAAAFYLYSQVPWQSFYLHVTMGLFAMSMSGLRQSLAAGIGILAIILLLKDRRLLFVVLIFLAYTFHNSALVLLPLALFSRVRFTRRNASIALVAASLATTQGAAVAKVIEWVDLQKYDPYFESVTEINPFVILMSLIVPVVALVLWPADPASWDRSGGARRVSVHSMMYLLSVLNFAFVALASEVPIMLRLTYYFVTFNAILIPNAISSCTNVKIRLAANAALLLLPLVFFSVTVPDSSLGIAPYGMARD